ncbi:MAG: ATP-dependent DNA ligase [Phycisphaeraceae bacterium]
MKRLTDLYLRLDATTKTNDKVEAMRDYFTSAPAEDACWAVVLLSGKRLTRTMKSSLLRQWAAEVSGHEPWLIERCYRVVGDLSETLALLIPPPEDLQGEGMCEKEVRDEPLHVVVRDRLEPLAMLDEQRQKKLVLDTWERFDTDERFLFHKLLRGGLRVGVSRALMVRALAQVVGLEPAVVDHRLTGHWRPSAEAFTSLLADEDGASSPSKPYPFMLAAQLDSEPDTLGPVSDWQVEYKWDGIRAQLIRREGEAYLWSRGEEQVADGFPEIVAAATALRQDAVLDGELLAWEDGRALPFGQLQKRLGRKHVELSLFPDVPVVFMAYDALEINGQDLRDQPMCERRGALESLLAKQNDIELSQTLSVTNWQDVTQSVATARELGVEGVMLKKGDSPYLSGRVRGPWWKWKADPYTIDAVLVQGQQGSGRRAGLYSSYTFAVWDDGELVPVTKSYSGLSNKEIEKVDRFIRKNTLARHGPVRVVKPELVFEIAFEGLQASTRHKSGVAFRFPRMSRWREDKLPKDADTIETVRAMLKAHTGM